MAEQHKSWTVKGGRVFTPAPFGIMGIVNLTPDSFHDGGRHHEPAAACAHARQLLAEGAHILDLGAESSRPGADPVSPEEEQRRLLPVLQALAQEACAPLLSVDTYHASTARAALKAGAHIINDISACLWDEGLLDVVAEEKPGYVLMHSQGLPKTMQKAPHYEDVVGEMLAFFEHHLQRLTAAGLPEAHIVLDPGIGFGKRLEHNVEILRHMDKILALGRPVLLGLSMKSLFGGLFDIPADAPESDAARATGTQVATALLAAQNVCLHRVHHVASTLRTLSLVRALRR